MEIRINGKKKKSTKKVVKSNYQPPKTKDIVNTTNMRYLKDLPQRVINSNKWYINTATEFKKQLLEKSTVYEAALCNYLYKKGNKVDFQKIIYLDTNMKINKFYIVDIYLPKYNLIIEVDGEYHYNSEQILKDNIRTSELKNMGYKLFRCNNEDTFNLDLLYSKIIKAIK